MRKSKRGPALFDLLNDERERAGEPLKVPSWWKSHGQSAPPRRRASSPAPHDDALPPASPTIEPPPVHATGMVEVDRERVRISLTSLTAAVTLFAVLVIVVGAFEVGRRSGERAGFARARQAERDAEALSSGDEIEAARNLPPATDLIEGLLVEPGETSHPAAVIEPPTNDAVGTQVDEAPAVRGRRERARAPSHAERALPAQTKWVRDYTYIVAQEFSAGHEADARRAREYMAENGVSAEIVRYPSGAIQLITIQGYNRNDSTQRKLSDDLLRKVRALGAAYFRQGGGYKLEGYLKTLKGDRW